MKPDTKGYILQDSAYLTCPVLANPQLQKVDLLSLGACEKGENGDSLPLVSFWGDENVPELENGAFVQLCAYTRNAALYTLKE